MSRWPTASKQPADGINWIRLRPGDAYIIVPNEWVPYVSGTGPAPQSAP